MTRGLALGSRNLSFRGCFDFRDLGGYPAALGRMTRSRRLYRSDGLHRLCPSDRHEIAGLGLATVIDLRTPAEVARQGTVPVAATRHHLPMEEQTAVLSGLGSPAAEAALVAERYYSALTAHVETVREVLAVLTDPSAYPAVVCCPSGVDRTGIVTAVVLGVIGVPDEVVVRDYAASRQAVVRRGGRLLFEHPSALHHDPDRYGPGPHEVVPGAMARFCDLVRSEHSSFTGYAASIDMAGAVPFLRSAMVEERA